MSKIAKASEETIELFKERAKHLNFEALKWNVHNQEDLKMTKDHMCGKVVINNPHAAMYGVDVIFVVNEDVFDLLTDEYQQMVIDKLFAQVNHDLEKEKTSKSTPDIQEFSGLLLKYGNQLLDLRSEIDRIYKEKKEMETGNDGSDLED
jgi:hypothetical protein